MTISSNVLDLAFCYLTVGTVESVIPMILAPGAGAHSIIMTDEGND